MPSFTFRRWTFLACLLGLVPSSRAADPLEVAVARAYLEADYPGVRFSMDNDRITRVYGCAFEYGSDAEHTADRFIANYSLALGVTPDELAPVGHFNDGHNTHQLMYDRQSGQHRFTLVYYSQRKEGVPVYGARLGLLFRNEPGFPLVLAVSSVRDLGDFALPAEGAAIRDDLARQQALAMFPDLVNFSEPETVVWAGLGDEVVEPALAVTFVADNGPRYEPGFGQWIFVADAATGQILHLASGIAADTTVSGTVDGRSTIPPGADVCADVELVDMSYARVEIGQDYAYADEFGDFQITTTAALPLTLASPIRGEFFDITNMAGENTVLEFSVTSGTGSVAVIHNEQNDDEFKRAEVNAYVYANTTRDFVLEHEPNYPQISTQNWQMEIEVNGDAAARYAGWLGPIEGGYILLRKKGQYIGQWYENEATLSTIAHEYTHHLEHAAGILAPPELGYTEGMADCVSVLVTGQSIQGPGYLGDCGSGYRTAENNGLYPCVRSNSHCCGTILSGSIWDTLGELMELHAEIVTTSDAIAVLAPLTLNQIVGAGPTPTLSPAITLDFLTLDDDDIELCNGTPHWEAICRGFALHGMTEGIVQCQDCNHNGVPDECDVGGGACSGAPGCGTSSDTNSNGIPDECECLGGLPASPVYVDTAATGNNDGSTWADAFTELQDALEWVEVCATTGTVQVWVAQGTYKPDRGIGNLGTGDRWSTFGLQDNTEIYGGFAGGETSLGQRDPQANETILSGDLAGDDLAGFVNTEENSVHVVTAPSGTDSTARLDGFTVCCGRADFDHPCGPEWDDKHGGGLYCDAGSPTIVNCTIRDNYADDRGAGVYVANGASPKLIGCTLTENAAWYSGGGMYSTGSGTAPALTNCVLAGNTGQLDGGAIYIADNSAPQLANCTFHGNRAYWGTGGAVLCSTSQVTIANSILWGDTAASGNEPELEVVGTSTVTVTYSDIEGGVWPGTGNVSSDPMFTGTGSWNDQGTPDDPLDDIWTEGDYRPLPGSPVNDAGNNSAVPADSADLDGDSNTTEPVPYDAAGSLRFADDAGATDTGSGTAPIVGMGAYETADCNSNDIPDECDLDCDAQPWCDVEYCGESFDCDTNGVPDDCVGVVAARSLVDHNGTEWALDLRGRQGGQAVQQIESRLGGVVKLELDLDYTPVTQPSVEVVCEPDSYSGTVDATTNGTTVTITFTPALPDKNTCYITVQGGAFFTVRALQGDLDYNSVVATTDAGIIKPHFGEPADADNFHLDFDHNGTIAPTDFGLVKSFFGNTVEECYAGGGDGAGGGGGGQGSEAPAEPWTYEEATVVLEVRPLGGGAPVTVLGANTTYEVHYRADCDNVDLYALFAVASSPDHGFAGAVPAPAGPWSATGNFVLVDIVEELGAPLTAPGYPDGYNRYYMATDEVWPGQGGDDPVYPDASGHLCNFTTQQAGELNLHLYMGWTDHGQHLTIEMETHGQFLVGG